MKNRESRVAKIEAQTSKNTLTKEVTFPGVKCRVAPCVGGTYVFAIVDCDLTSIEHASLLIVERFQDLKVLFIIPDNKRGYPEPEEEVV
jgi:hypothetical protein